MHMGAHTCTRCSYPTGISTPVPRAGSTFVVAGDAARAHLSTHPSRRHTHARSHSSTRNAQRATRADAAPSTRAQLTPPAARRHLKQDHFSRRCGSAAGGAYPSVTAPPSGSYGGGRDLGGTHRPARAATAPHRHRAPSGVASRHGPRPSTGGRGQSAERSKGSAAAAVRQSPGAEARQALDQARGGVAEARRPPPPQTNTHELGARRRRTPAAAAARLARGPRRRPPWRRRSGAEPPYPRRRRPRPSTRPGLAPPWDPLAVCGAMRARARARAKRTRTRRSTRRRILIAARAPGPPGCGETAADAAGARLPAPRLRGAPAAVGIRGASTRVLAMLHWRRGLGRRVCWKSTGWSPGRFGGSLRSLLRGWRPGFRFGRTSVPRARIL